MPATPPPTKTKRTSVRDRLTRAHEHPDGVMAKIDEVRPYREVLQRIAAVRAALAEGTLELVDDLVARVRDAPAGKTQDVLEELRSAVRPPA